MQLAPAVVCSLNARLPYNQVINSIPFLIIGKDIDRWNHKTFIVNSLNGISLSCFLVS